MLGSTRTSPFTYTPSGAADEWTSLSAMPWTLVGDVADVIEVQTLRLSQRLVQIVILADEPTFTSALGLRTGLFPVSPPKLGLQK
jgi:hypothetical protein